MLWTKVASALEGLNKTSSIEDVGGPGDRSLEEGRCSRCAISSSSPITLGLSFPAVTVRDRNR